jgi:hypothetical protein
MPRRDDPAILSPRVIGENDFASFVERDRYGNERLDEVTQHKYVPDQRGAMFTTLLQAWGMVTGFRHTFRGGPAEGVMELMPVEQVVERAATMTRLAYHRMDQEGWLVKIERSLDGK